MYAGAAWLRLPASDTHVKWEIKGWTYDHAYEHALKQTLRARWLPGSPTAHPRPMPIGPTQQRWLSPSPASSALSNKPC